MKQLTHNRIISFLLALLLLVSDVPSSVFAGANDGNGTTSDSSTGTTQSQLQYDYDTMYITREGEQIRELSLLSHEKIEITAGGVTEEAKYQWQILNPERENQWINIYDATKPTLSLTVALLNNMLFDNGTAQVRCLAYTDDYVYATSPFTVTIAQEEPGVSQTASISGRTLLTGGGATTPEFVTVQIEYIQYAWIEQPDGTFKEVVLGQAFTPYIATLKSGTDLATNVTSPTIVGFEPKWTKTTIGGVEDDHADKDGTMIGIDLEDINADVVYTVEYHAAEVNYEVHYFFQNIYDDLYAEDSSLAETKSLKGITGQRPDPTYTELVVPGFTSLYYEPETIAADGSTVFSVYYERDYYLMEFDCNGGYGTDTIYVRYGTYISVPIPTRMGYEFAGWNKGIMQTDSNGTPIKDADGKIIINYEQTFDPDNSSAFTPATLPATMPHENTYYRAEWKTVATTYTVAYWRENADDEGYSFWGNAIIGLGANGEPDGTVKSNDKVSGTNNLTNTLPLCGERVHDHTTSGCTQNCGETEHTHETGCVRECGIAEHNHSIECYGATGYVVATNSHTGYSTLSAITNPNDDYVYRYRQNNWRYYNYFYDGTTWYYLGEGTQYRGLIDSVSDPGSNGGYNSAKTNKTASCGQTDHSHVPACGDCVLSFHAHNSSCYSCGLTDHAHSANCYTDESQYFTFKEADQNVTVKGDGSTVVNVYYDRKEYELRFYYARTNTSGTGDIYISDYTRSGYLTTSSGADCINGSGYGSTGAPTWKTSSVSTLPEIISSYYNSGEGISSYDVIGNYRFYYLSFKAKYKSNIEDEWPAAAFGPLNNDIWNFGSWATESGSQYRTDHGANNANIVGAYPYLTPDLIVDPNAEVAHHFVAWWGQEGRGTNQNDNVAPHHYHIYYEVMPGHESDAGVISYSYNGETKYFRLSRELTFNASHKNSSPTRVDPFEYNGYEIFGVKEDSNSADNKNNDPGHDGHYCNTYYYTRNEYTLSFFNYNDVSAAPSPQTLKFEEPLSAYKQGKPEYPTGIEPNAYEFVGWYTTPVFDENTKMTDDKWNSMTMPEGNVTLYAKWVPLKRNVYFYELYSDVANNKYWYTEDLDGNKVPDKYPIEVEHGALLGTTYNYLPTRAGYHFIGWFYMDEDNKKKFAPDTMEIRRDLHLFAEWQSNIDTNYEISYVLENTTTAIAEPTKGHSSAGKTKTFTAKAGVELLTEYQTKPLFPVTNSHSILMEEQDAEKTKNKFVFEYIEDDGVWYRIRYVNKVDNTDLRPAETTFTLETIVTPKFVPIEGYLPEKYYIRKALAADGKGTGVENMNPENEIIFYYTPDADHGIFSVEYYQETVDGSGFELIQSRVGYADIGEEVTAEILDKETGTMKMPKFTGFTYDPTRNEKTEYVEESGSFVPKKTTGADAYKGEVSVAGLEIKIYYTRNSYKYTIIFEEYGSTPKNILGYGKAGDPNIYAVQQEITAKFGSTVSYTAPDTIKKTVAGEEITYVFHTTTIFSQEKEQSMKMRADDTGNVLTFYYSAKETTVIYEAVCTSPGVADFGAVTLNQEAAATVSGLGGSDAVAGDGFRFVGWSYNKAGTDLVPTEWVQAVEVKDDRGTPDTGDDITYIHHRLKPKNFNKADVATDTLTFYAVFEPILTSMTIKKDVKDGAGNALTTTDNFLFSVKGQGKFSYVDLTVLITGNGTVLIEELPVGTYTVTELTGWSWEYSSGYTVSHSNGEIATEVDSTKNVITFTNTYIGSDWLNSESEVKDNNFD